MDITAQSFYYHLPRILDDLTTCVFVSLDFEFSGIAGASLGRTGKPQTLQQRYQEVKDSADKYQILQVGLTICHEDTQAATYTLKPYNLYLSPIIDRKLEVERNWSFQSSAVEFLLENKFSMNALLKEGVPYLSREEEEKAIAHAIERQNRTTVHKSLDVKETEYESIAFLQTVRQLVDDWLNLGKKRDNYLNIPPPSNQIKAQELSNIPPVLNRFQKRLVHQLVEVEYPFLVTIGRPTFVQIIEYDEDREKTIREQKLKWTQERAWKQRGFRWVAEAMTGGDLSNLDPHCFAGIKANSIAVERGCSLNEFSDRLKKRLKAHRPVLVGHNLFSDVIYFCRCFFGPLPDRVEDFQSMMHGFFPLLVDTKYMATHNCGSINPRSSLQEINDNLLKTPKPLISVHPQHFKYHSQKIDHEAGYDSLLTAQVFIKLSAQLQGIPEAEIESPQSTPSSGRFTSTRFNMHDMENTLDEISNPSSAVRTSTGAMRVGMGKHPLEAEFSDEERHKVDGGDLIPRLDSHFWKIYGNKLRVFGTEERICPIG